MNCHANKSIECTVQQCANHCEGENLSLIHISEPTRRS